MLAHGCLQVASTPSVLKPGDSTEISITFVPTAAKEYTTAVPLRVMGLYDINIPLKGKGGPITSSPGMRTWSGLEVLVAVAAHELGYSCQQMCWTYTAT